MEQRKSLTYLLLSFLLFACSDSKKTEEWQLVFEDDFDTTLVQWNVWESGAFNQEIQFYRPAQVKLNDGMLEVSSRREAISGRRDPHNSEIKQFEYVSGRIESKQLFAPSAPEGENRYRFQARIRLPFGHGMWPAFWTYGDPWPTKGEIDILEFRGGEPDRFISNIFYGNEAGKNINKNSVQKYEIEDNLSSTFHIYEMIWSRDSIEIVFDGKKLHTYISNEDNNISSFFGQEQKVVLNTAVGGIFFDDRNSANYADSAQMSVDWVRVYKQ